MLNHQSDHRGSNRGPEAELPEPHRDLLGENLLQEVQAGASGAESEPRQGHGRVSFEEGREDLGRDRVR